MIHIKDIMTRYQKGDFEERLNLFLECRELRHEFTAMDQEGSPAPIQTTESEKKVIPKTGWTLMSRWNIFFTGMIHHLRRSKILG